MLTLMLAFPALCTCALDWQFCSKTTLHRSNIVDTPLAARVLATRESGKQLDGLATARLRKKGKQNMCYAVYSLLSLLSARGALCKTEVLQVWLASAR